MAGSAPHSEWRGGGEFVISSTKIRGAGAPQGGTMRGLMMDRPLLIGSLIQYAAEYHGDTEIVTRTVEGPFHRYSYVEAERRSRQLAKALKRLGIGFGDRVATIAWNGHRH